MTPAPSDPGAELESLAGQLCELEDWQGAVQMKAQAAALASAESFELLDRRYQEAFDLAAAHDLLYLELSVRLNCAQLELTTARAGGLIDTLSAEAKSRNSELLQRIRQYSDEALSTCSAMDAALAAPAPDPPALLAAVDAGIQAARRFELYEAGGRLSDWRAEKGQSPFTPEALAEIGRYSARLRGELEGRRALLLTQADILRAGLKAVHGDFDSQIEILTRALPAAGNLPEWRAQLHMALADAYCARAEVAKLASPQAAAADLELAEQAAANAVADVEPLGDMLVKDAPAAKLNEVRALRNPGAAAATPPANRFYGVMALRNSALQALQQHRPADALALLDQAINAPGAPPPGMSLGVRASAYYELGRYAEAIADLDARIAELERQAQADAGEFSYAFGHRLEELQNLSLVKACALTQLGRFAEAWEATERGRAAAPSGRPDAPNPAVPDWESWRGWLAGERAAFISFALGRWGALVLAAAPGDAQPSATILPSYRYSDLAPQFLNSAEEDSRIWTSIIFGAVPDLSSRLIQPVQPILERIAAQAEALYILPDSYLFRAPFPALTLSDGRFLNDLCPLATAPSAAFVLANAGRPRTATSSCLALGVGQTPKDKPVVRFSEQASDVAQLWAAPRAHRALLDAAATAAALGDAAAFDVLHLACHGATSSQVFDPLAASQLELADRALSAREALAWRLNADLVFMNVCQGGRFRMEGRANLSGFLRAFHAAGARSVIASVTHIDPVPAGELALRFYRHWFTGVSKARALQQARQEVRQLYPAPKDWASHALTGDHR